MPATVPRDGPPAGPETTLGRNMPDQPPIVFLPGVMGSRLYFQNSGKFWDPDSTLRMLRWLPIWPFRSNDDNRRELHAREPAAVMIDPLDAGSMDAQEVRLGWGRRLRLAARHALAGRVRRGEALGGAGNDGG